MGCFAGVPLKVLWGLKKPPKPSALTQSLRLCPRSHGMVQFFLFGPLRGGHFFFCSFAFGPARCRSSNFVSLMRFPLAPRSLGSSLPISSTVFAVAAYVRYSPSFVYMYAPQLTLIRAVKIIKTLVWAARRGPRDSGIGARLFGELLVVSVPA